MPEHAPEPNLQQGGSETALRVVLVNSMADAALAVTEQRFARLLRAAFPSMPITLQCVTPPQITRGEMASARIARHYCKIQDVFHQTPDAVIFSGAEPRTERLDSEAFWPCLCEMFDWVQLQNIPSLFSCLAAHAAVLHFSGVQRHRLARKAFGFFTQSAASGHPLLHGMTEKFGVAHSRWNEIRADDLADCGYQVLTSGPHTEVDMFVRKGASHLVFLQGHPEYEPTALEGEYKRDLRRFLAGEGLVSPDMPFHAEEASGAPCEGVQAFAPVIKNWIASRKEQVA